jgi:hypothetical protein
MDRWIFILKKRAQRRKFSRASSGLADWKKDGEKPDGELHEKENFLGGCHIYLQSGSTG